MPKIFISYRRSDVWAAARLFDNLVSHYGADSVFMDVENIDPGVDFRDFIKTVLLESGVLIAVIGPKWLGVTSDEHLRIQDDDDPVRMEIETAFASNVHIIPVLIDSAKMPDKAELPDSLRNLVFRHAAEIGFGPDFRQQVDRLIRAIDRISGNAGHTTVVHATLNAPTTPLKELPSEALIEGITRAKTDRRRARFNAWPRFNVWPRRPLIFVSYRRADTKWLVGRISERLETRFGKSAVFLDIETIPAGSDFRKHLEEILQRCNIVLAVIGPNWHGPTPSGQSRLFDANDFVRIEIETALKKNIPVIPVTIDRAPMPKANELPAGLRAFADLQAVNVDSGLDFNIDLRRLIVVVVKLTDSKASIPRYALYAAISASVVALVVSILFYAVPPLLFNQTGVENEPQAIAECNTELTLQCAQKGGVFGANEALTALRTCKSAELIASDDLRLRWKDIWTTSVYSFAPGGGGPGGGLDNDELRVGGWGDWYIALVQFDVPPLRMRPRFAGLALYSKESEGASVPIEVDRTIQRWEFRKGDRLWWKDKPGARAITTEPLPAPKKEQWYLIDLTKTVLEWVDGKTENYGVQIRPVNNFGSFVFFVSSKAADKSKIPRLVSCS